MPGVVLRECLGGPFGGDALGMPTHHEWLDVYRRSDGTVTWKRRCITAPPDWRRIGHYARAVGGTWMEWHTVDA